MSCIAVWKNNAQNRSQSILYPYYVQNTRHIQGSPVKHAFSNAIKITKPKLRVFPLKLSCVMLPNFPKESLVISELTNWFPLLIWSSLSWHHSEALLLAHFGKTEELQKRFSMTMPKVSSGVLPSAPGELETQRFSQTLAPGKNKRKITKAQSDKVMQISHMFS